MLAKLIKVFGTVAVVGLVILVVAVGALIAVPSSSPLADVLFAAYEAALYVSLFFGVLALGAWVLSKLWR